MSDDDRRILYILEDAKWLELEKKGDVEVFDQIPLSLSEVRRWVELRQKETTDNKDDIVDLRLIQTGLEALEDIVTKAGTRRGKVKAWREDGEIGVIVEIPIAKLSPGTVVMLGAQWRAAISRVMARYEMREKRRDIALGKKRRDISSEAGKATKILTPKEEKLVTEAMANEAKHNGSIRQASKNVSARLRTGQLIDGKRIEISAETIRKIPKVQAAWNKRKKPPQNG